MHNGTLALTHIINGRNNAKKSFFLSQPTINMNRGIVVRMYCELYYWLQSEHNSFHCKNKMGFIVCVCQALIHSLIQTKIAAKTIKESTNL